MDMVVVFLCSMSGALVGTALGIILMFPKVLRQPTTEAGADALKGKLRSAEDALAAKAAELENLNKQIGEKDRTIQRNEEALKAEQQRLDIAAAECAASGERARELSAQAEALAEQRTQLEAKVKEESERGAEMVNRQVASYQEQIDADKRKFDELTEQVARLSTEAAEIGARCEQEKHDRSSVEAELGAERERIREMTTRIQQLESERSLFDLRLEEERQSATKGMELLLMAQENFARVVKPRDLDGPNGSNGHGPIEAVGAAAEAPGEDADALHPALAGD
jgi:chromosome segregation ATPase